MRRYPALISPLLTALLILVCAASPLRASVPDSTSDIVARGGETPSIVHFRYRNVGDTSAAAAVRVWRFRIRDGGPAAPDLDSFPTILDSIDIHVMLAGRPGVSRTTRSISWAGLYTDEPTPRLIAVGAVNLSSITFARIADTATTAPDDSVRDLDLYLKFDPQPFLGDRLAFSVGFADVLAGHPTDTTSAFGPFTAIESDTTGENNRIVTNGLRIEPWTPLPIAGAPSISFGIEAILVDSTGEHVHHPDDSMRVTFATEFGALSGELATVVDSVGIFRFDSLHYPYRNDSAAFFLYISGVDSLWGSMVFTGGLPDVPTVTHIEAGSVTPRVIEGTGLTITFPRSVTRGSFLTERIERAPVPNGPLPENVNQIAARYFRLTADTALTFDGTYDLSMPVIDLPDLGHPVAMLLMYRPDSLAAWASPASTSLGGDGVTIRGRFRSFGEIGLGANRDVAVGIKFSGFTATARGDGGVMLRWSTASEWNNAGFIVRRSHGAEGPFTSIDSYRFNSDLAGMGTSPVGAEYGWDDDDPALIDGEIYHYLLTDVAIDGTERAHGPVSVRVMRDRSLFIRSTSGYPSPFTDRVMLLMDVPVPGPIVVRLWNMRGELVLTHRVIADMEGVARVEIDGAALGDGVYLYTMNAGMTTVRGTVVKQTQR